VRGHRFFSIAGAAATLWAAAHAFVYFDRGGPLEPHGAELPTTITVFFAMAIAFGVVGGIALAFRRQWAATLLWISWLGVLIDGAWAPGLYGNFFQRGPIDLGVATLFAVVAQWNSGRKTSRISGKASSP
jgi:hypothetical protein